MPLAASDIQIRFTVLTGAAGDSVAGTAAGSLGKYVSTTQVPAGLNGLYDDISAAENTALTDDYRAVGILNNSATNAANNVVAYLSAETAGGANISIAVDNAAASAKGSASAQGSQIASETAVPSAVGAFSSPTTAGAGLSLGTIGIGQVRFLWVKRHATNSASIDNDGVTLAIQAE